MNCMRDWLDLHGFQRVDLVEMIQDSPCYSDLGIDDSDPLDLGVGAAWDLIFDAFSAGFDGAGPLLQDARHNITLSICDQMPDDTAPYTKDNGPGTYPEIQTAYNATAADFVMLAHEAGHAVQILASHHAFMPPAFRETCAFLAELMVSRHLANIDHPTALAFEVARQKDANLYLGEDLEALYHALAGDLSAHYTYRWNYPVAATLAARLWVAQTRAPLFAIFASGGSAADVLTTAGAFGTRAEANPLPSFPATAPQDQVTQTYRLLGAMVLLDTSTDGGPAEMPIDDYYQRLKGPIHDGTAFVGFAPLNKPMGYATWSGSGDTIQITRQSAPFGDHLALQQMLRAHLPTDCAITSGHPDSARAEQQPW